jgi:hypothetical protein
MSRSINVTVVGAVLLMAGPVAAQYYPPNGWYRPDAAPGYVVRGFGYYDGYVLAGPGGYEAYYAGVPIVTTLDPWGRVADVPLRPKVLYYSDRIMTPYGPYYPVSIAMIPDDRPRPRPEPPRTEALPTFRYDPGTPAKPAPPPAPLMPRAAELDVTAPPRPAPATPLPPVPKLPDLPAIPDAPKPGANDGPKLGPSPGDVARPPK